MIILCNKNYETLTVELEHGIITKIGEVLDQQHLPLCLQTTLNLETANRWLQKRKIPDNREGLKEAKHMIGTEPFGNYKHMFSLTDQYWFKHGQKESWRKLNFFTNPYNSSIGQAIFVPWDADIEKMKEEGPDLTTNGVLRKMWVQDDSLNSYMIKAGSRFFHQEPLSEVLATLTLQKIEGFIPYVHYDFCVNGMRICSRCRNFIDENTEFIPAQYVYNRQPRLKQHTQYQHLLMMLEDYGLSHPGEFIDKMLFADHVIGNVDRHMGNFGIIHNVETDSVKFAPLFDFGSAFREYYQNKKAEKARLFNDEIARCVRMYERRASLKTLANIDDLMNLINTYPALTEVQKAAIKEGIRNRSKPFDYSDNIRGGARSR